MTFAYNKYPAVECVMPLGLPVLPDVYNINKVSSLSLSTAGQTVDSDSNAWIRYKKVNYEIGNALNILHFFLSMMVYETSSYKFFLKRVNLEQMN